MKSLKKLKQTELRNEKKANELIAYEIGVYYKKQLLIIILLLLL